MRNFNAIFVLIISGLITTTFFNSKIKANEDKTNLKEWTFLVYLNGNNSLDSFGELNISQMEKIGSTPDINIIVQWASLKNKKTQRLYVTRSNTTDRISSPILEDMGNVDMGNWKNLVDFISWGAKNFPAKHYFVDIWNHGGGWHSIRTASNKANYRSAPPLFHSMDISWDDNTGNAITTQQLGIALHEAAQHLGHKIDLYGSDACLMAMAEVADEVADSVSIYAGSEETIPGAGWPYDKFLERWKKTPKASAAEVSRYLTEEYIRSYSGGTNGHQDATFSSFNLQKISPLNQSILKLKKNLVLLDSKSKSEVINAAQTAQSFYDSDYIDLMSFINNLNAKNILTLDKATLKELENSVKQFVINHGETHAYQRAQGLSIWIPTNIKTYDTYSNTYKSLKFHAHTEWDDALRSLLN